MAFISCILLSYYRGIVVLDGGHGWFHTLRRGGCQAPCLRVFPLVTALPAIGPTTMNVVESAVVLVRWGWRMRGWLLGDRGPARWL